jgi:pyruvate dehydrogenase E2 component (dihydrolipoamide acetyltransferase)
VATEVKVPRLGQGMESATVVRWLKAEGDQVAKGEPLYEVDTEKVTQEVDAEAEGVLLKIVVQEGEQAVGTTIAYIGEAGEEVAAPSPGPSQDDAPSQDDGAARSAEKPAEAPEREPDREQGRAAAATAAEAERPAAGGGANGRVKASPLARRIARERGIDIAALSGTGPDGRIVAEDVERAAAQGPAPARVAAVPTGDVERRELSRIRKTIARRLTEAWQAPAFQLTVDIDMSRANELLGRVRELNPDVRITHTDILTKVCAAALLRHRDVNAQYTGDELLIFPTANVGIAVATAAGLVVPVVQGADRLTIAEIAGVRADLVARARDGKLQTGDLEGGTFTISNLGMYGIDQFIAVLNPPQAAILAVGQSKEQVVVEDGELAIRPILTATLTCDHRAVDGAEGADFLRTVKTYLEEPGLAL